MLGDLIKDVNKEADPAKALLLAKYFKTAKGEYGEGDIFLGLTVPESRKIAIKHSDLNLKDVSTLLKNKIHEYRFIALAILLEKFSEADKSKDEKVKKTIFDFYLNNTKYINNWDLVDLSAPKIVGKYLSGKSKSERKILYKFIASENLWERRIAVLATFNFIKHKEFKDSLNFAETLIKDEHDLIHKASGWMLRELGKVSPEHLEMFLDKYSKRMPRTMLRYSIERMPQKTRKHYMAR